MKKSVNNETYLAHWISGSLGDAELKSLASEDEFDSYILLREVISKMQSISPDVEAAYSQLKHKKTLSLSLVSRTTKFKRMIYASAAVMLLFVTIMTYHLGYFGANNFVTSSQSKQVYIGKNISILLYQNTSIAQDAPLYNGKEIELHYGEAYFEVQKGQPFTIKTADGYVQVLGTKFKVKSNNNALEVKCFEGKVKVNYLGLDYFVSSGHEFNSYTASVQVLDEKDLPIADKRLSYQKFESVNMVDVKAFLEQNYDVKVIFPKRILNQKFTGTLSNDELKLSLGLIASSFHLDFEIKNKHVIFKE